MNTQLTHFDAAGNAVMVDVSGKAVTAREATAHGCITMNEAAFAAVESGTVKKKATCWVWPASRASWRPSAPASSSRCATRCP